MKHNPLPIVEPPVNGLCRGGSRCWLLLLIAILSPATTLGGDGPEDNRDDVVRVIPPPGIELSAADRDQLLRQCGAIRDAWRALKTETASDQARLNDLEAEVLVFPRSVELAIKYQQFYKPADVRSAREVLEVAEQRVQRIAAGGDWADVVGLTDGRNEGLIVGGFTSAIDGSFQPYAVVAPRGLSRNDARPRRLDIWFHGRGERESEAKFLAIHALNAGIYQPADTIVLHPYGRYSNAFRFAGEVDVFEALRYIQGRLPVDESKLSVRGFSMGGAACWQFATRYADRWFAANPGAGFSETVQFLSFFQGEDVLKTAPVYQQKMWSLYDNPLVASNLVHCPVVAYSGEIDRQKQAADVMEARLRELGIDMVHVIGPDTEHKIHPQSQVDIEERMRGLAKLDTTYPPTRISLTTYTLQHNRMHWVELLGLAKHWEKSSLDAEVTTAASLPGSGSSEIVIRTSNVQSFRLNFEAGEWPGQLNLPVSIKIDDATIASIRPKSDRSLQAVFSKQGNSWVQDGEAAKLRKKPGLQGPIDDAFLSPFIFVLPSQPSANSEVARWIAAEAEHAMQHWEQHFRGDINKILDVDLTEQHIASKNLILFGDPKSNQAIAKLAPHLPVKWTETAIEIADASYASDSSAVVLIYPNPLNSERYIVLNSGFTYREYDYLNNARQTPKLPDWAIIDITTGTTPRGPGAVRQAGFFDEHWQP